jgi:hypothetical protein
MARKSAFLAEPDWLTVPFSQHPAGALQSLISEAVCVPAILESLDQARQSDQGLGSELVERASGDLLEVYMRFDITKSAFATYLAAPLYYPPTASADGDAMIQFPGAYTAVTVIRYWTFRAICLMELRELSVSHPEIVQARRNDFEAVPNLSPGTLLADCTALARNIYQAIPYLAQTQMNIFGPTTTIFPLRTALEVLKAGGETTKDDFSRCKVVVASIRGRGYHLPNFDDNDLQRYTRCHVLDS